MNEIHDFRAKRLFRDLLDFLYPPLCQVCRNNFESSEGNIWICPKCYAILAILPQAHCAVCRAPVTEPGRDCLRCRQSSRLQWVYSLGIYDESFSHLIKAFKYEGKEGLGKMLGKMLGEQLTLLPITRSVNLVCAIPIDPKKESKRGFNQTEILAAEVAKCLNVRFETEVLSLTRKNRDQIGLSVRERYYNVRDVFQVDDEAAVRGKHILIVDDVTTSGATLQSVARCLLNAGASSVAAATVAMALEDGLEPHLLHDLMSEDHSHA